MHEVAITGIGIVSVIGTGIEKVARALKAGKSGVRIDTVRQEMGFRGALTGFIADFDPPKLSRKKRKTMPEFVQHAYHAALEAIVMAAWEETDVRHPKTGLIIGNDSSALANVHQASITQEKRSTLEIGSSVVFHALNSTTTMNLNTLLGNQGASWTLSAACASGGHAIGQAADLIALGRQDRMICGGVQEINWESVSSFDATNAFSIRHQDPELASRPFDSERDGLVPSGGAAIVALERMDLAKKRGIPILGRLLAYAFSSDGSDLAVPSGAGLEYCMRECMDRAKMTKDGIDYICAHATSTPVGDVVEARAIHGIFGSNSPWVSSTKSMTGHEMWMSGAAQVVYSVIMGKEGFIAPNINFTRQEDSAPALKIATETLDTKPRIILLNSAGFGGPNSCLLIEAAS